jgi:endonuclease-8
MPEGDTIHKLAAYLAPRLEGRRVDTVSAADARAAARCAGRCVRQVYAHGKHLFIEFDNAWLMRSHLGMYGAWHRYACGEPWQKPRRQMSISLTANGEEFVCFNAKEIEWLNKPGIRERIVGTRLGPDLAVVDPDLDTVLRRAREFAAEDRLLADVLLDQRIAAGIGNVYKSEVLFLERCSPWQRLGQTSDETLHGCFDTAADLLRRNLGGGPRVTRFEGDGAGRLWVYRRRGLPCFECDTRIESRRIGVHHRGTYWCPSCQLR